MASVAKWLPFVFGLIFLARSVTALRCWECSSNMNPMCGDPMNTTEHQATFHITDCDRTHYHTPKPVCRKIVKRDYGERVIIRSCYTPNVDEVDIVDGPCHPVSTDRSIVESCNICSTELCNSAMDTSATFALYLGALALGGYRFILSGQAVL